MKRIRSPQPEFSPFSRPQPLVSIVAVCFHHPPPLIRRCLEALRELDYPRYEVIVVDNGSSEETIEALRQSRRTEKLILNSCNRGFAGGCNDGMAEADGEIIVLLNLDTVVEPAWLFELIRPICENKRVAITGCKSLYPDGTTIQHAGGNIHPNGMTEHIGYQESDNGQFDEERDVDFVTGASLAVRRDFLERYGGLDEDFYPAYYEDVDFCYRARQMGYRVVYVPTARLTHVESAVTGMNSPLFRRLYFGGRIVFCLKNFRLRDWLFGFISMEWRWLRAPYSKGYRRLQLRAYLDGLQYLLGRRARQLEDLASHETIQRKDGYESA